MKKNIYRTSYWFAGVILLTAGCTKDFDEISKDPNNPTEVSTPSLMTYAQKNLMDDIRDEWFSGRQSYLYAQYFAQRTYTEEDRYQLRQPTNNTYWRLIYNDMKNLQEIIRLNTDPATKEKASVYGKNENQIAAARILKAWAFQTLTDAYGDIPYTEALQGETILTPKYTPQQEIYADLIKELTEASNQLDMDASVFTTGDIIYNGDPVKWKKLANSLKMRVALRTSKVPGSNYKAYIQEAIDAKVFESNADNAVFKYIGVTPNNAPLYDAYFTSNRNDFTLAQTFVDLLAGRKDTLNEKVNPFLGLYDPRLEWWADGRVDTAFRSYVGMPYGIPNSATATPRSKAFSMKGSVPNNIKPSVVLSASLPEVFMDYAEVCFILSEFKDWDQNLYKEGVKASLEYWSGLTSAHEGWSKDHTNKYAKDVENYVAALPSASEETVLTQKYVALFLQGYEAWSEYRRTGYPKTLVKPGEVNYEAADGTSLVFNPLVGNEIPRRINYPVIEQTLNSASYNAAKAAIGGSDDLDTHVWWNK